MKEVVRIHIAKIAYDAEISAKKKLEKYLHEIKANMSADDATMQEIEHRIVELLAENGVRQNGVITEKDVDYVQEKLGDSREFIDDENQSESPDESDHAADDRKSKKYRKLYRDTEQGWLGGVLAGVANYFSVDPLLIRLIFLVLIFASFSTILLVYLILWILVPEAKTEAEKLQMHGKNVTLQSLKNASERSIDAAKRAGRPLATILRYIFGVGFAVTTALTVAFMVITLLRSDLFGAGDSMHWVFFVSFVLFELGLGLFAILMALLTHATFSAKFDKKIAIAAVVVTTLGLSVASVLGVIVIVGATGGEQIWQNIKNNPEALSEIESEVADRLGIVDSETYFFGDMDIKGLKIDASDEDSSGSEVVYHITENSSQHRVEVKSEGGKSNKSKLVDVEFDDDVMELSVLDSDAIIYIYGPKLEAVEMTNVNVKYAADK